jgi:hypothetical protein
MYVLAQMVSRAQAELVVSQDCVLKTVPARLLVLQAPNVQLRRPPVQRTTFSASEDSAKPQVAKAALAQKDVNLEISGVCTAFPLPTVAIIIISILSFLVLTLIGVAVWFKK